MIRILACAAGVTLLGILWMGLQAGSVAHAPDAVQDPGMTLAQAEAQRTLPRFFAQVSNPDGTTLDSALVKVALAVPGGGPRDVEVVWVGPFARTENGFRGVLANRPHRLPGVAAGDAVAFDMGMIRDWMVVDPEGRIWGAYTTRAMVKDMTPDAVEALMARLSETPVPPHWPE